MPGAGLDTRPEDVRVLLRRFIEEVINGRDLDRAMKDIVAEDDRIMAHSTWTGTHRGEIMRIPATGN